MINWIKEKGRFLLIALSCLLVLLAVAVYFSFSPSYNGEIDIVIGAFSDSFWEVQNGFSYRILDNAIERFEAAHPGVKVRYESGVQKEDYSEWLTERILNESAPDLFFVLPEDFNDLTELNALEDLGKFIKREPEGFVDSFYTSAFAYGQNNGKQYTIPYECA